MTQLQISSDLALPLEAVTETFAIIAKRRVGKSNAAVVMAEQMYDAGIPWVAIDPKGDWWGVRSSGDGKGEGLAVPVFGGLHADVPLEPSAGAYMADLIAERRLTCVLDISQFSKAEEIRFLQPLAERLLKVNSEPLHLFFEECDDYIPQEKGADELHVVRAFSRLIRHGGFKGIGSTLITQRAALVSKNVLAQTETLIVFRTTHPPDQKQVADWIKGHEASATVLPSLSSLPVGQAWVLSPGFLGTVEQITFNRRRTYDSGATPKVGERRTDPTRLADVDLAVIKEAMAETIERAKADDPKELRKRIAELERQLRDRPAVEPEIIHWRIDVVPPHVLEIIEAARGDLTTIDEHLRQAIDLADRVNAAAEGETPVTGRPRDVEAGERRTRPEGRPVRTAPAAPSRATEMPRGGSSRPAGDGTITKPQQKVLDAFAWLEAVGFPEPTKIQVGFIAGYRVGKNVGGTFGNLLGQLRSEGLIDYPTAGRAALTAAGRAVAHMPDIEPTTDGLQAAVHARLTDPESRVLTGIIDAYPDAITKQDAGAIAGYTVGANVGGTFGNILGRLRTLGLIDYPQPGYVVALPVLFLETA